MDAIVASFNQTPQQANESKAWYEQGKVLAKEGCHDDALASFDRAIAIQPDNHLAWGFRAAVLIHLERYSEALANCEKALAIDPNYSEGWVFRGAALNYLGRYQQSYASYDRSLGIERKSAGQKLSQMFRGLFGLVSPLTRFAQ